MMKPFVNYSFGSKWVVGTVKCDKFPVGLRVSRLLIECFYNWSWWILKRNRIINKGNEWKYFHTSRGSFWFFNCSKRLNAGSCTSIDVLFSHDIELKSRNETINGNEWIFFNCVFSKDSHILCRIAKMEFVLWMKCSYVIREIWNGLRMKGYCVWKEFD